MAAPKLFALFCLVLFNSFLYAQSPVPSKPLSPEAAAIGKYINFPVSYNTGLPQIDIPLYEIIQGDLKIPISISYHSSGDRPNERSGWVGLGWSLNAEPSITRTINGLVDEHGFIDNNTNSAPNSADPYNIWDYRRGLSNGIWDEQPDEFYYKTLSKSGKFYFKKSNLRSAGYTVSLQPYEPLKVDFNNLNTFEVTDENGIFYRYGTSLRSGNTENIELNGAYTTVWKASEIISAKSKDTISFDYHPFVSEQVSGMYDFIRVTDSLQHNSSVPYIVFGCEYSSPIYLEEGINGIVKRSDIHMTTGELTSTYCDDNYIQTTGSQLWTRKIKEIKFNTGKVSFELGADESQKLIGISIYNLDGALQKKYKFFQSTAYSPGSPGIQMLDSIQVLDAMGVRINSYKFSYTTKVLPGYISRSLDYLGYYNAADNISLIGRTPIHIVQDLPGETVNIIVGNANREPNATAAKAGMLTSIVYPTGGKTTFAWEGNFYFNQYQQTLPAPGLRIAKIEDFDPSTGAILTKKFTYGSYGQGGRLRRKISPYDYVTQQIFSRELNSDFYAIQIYGERKRTFHSSINASTMFEGGSPVVYDEVKETRTGNYGETLGWSVYQYDYNFSSYYYNQNYLFFGTSLNADPQEGWMYGKLLSKSDFNNIGQMVKSVSDTYSLFKPDSIPVGKTYFKKITGEWVTTFHPSPTNPYEENFYYPYSIHTGAMRLTSRHTVEFNGGQSTDQVTSYEYKNLTNLEPTKEIVTTSSGKALSTYTLYPHDYPSSGNAAFIEDLKNSNMVNLPIEKVTSLSENNIVNIVSGNIFKYKEGGRGLISEALRLELLAPLPVSNFKFSNRSIGTLPPSGTGVVFNPDSKYKKVTSFGTYGPRGNVLQYSSGFSVNGTGGKSTSFLWDYKGQFLVAQAENAGPTDIAYTSFETDNTGNWTYNGQAIIDTTAVTGKKVFALNGTAIAKSGLNASENYILTCWVKGNGGISVNGGTVLPSIGGVTEIQNGWILYRYIFSNLSSVTILNSGGSPAYVDEIRLYPTKGSMESYTYDPFAGITSMADASNKVSTYEYDSFQRLRAIRNQKKELLKYFNYKMGRVPSIDSATVLVPQPSPQPTVPVFLLYAQSSSDICLANSSSPGIVAYISAVDNSYYSDSFYTNYIANGYYKETSSSTYRYIVNGQVQSTGSCTSAPFSTPFSFIYSASITGVCSVAGGPSILTIFRHNVSNKYYSNPECTILATNGYYRVGNSNIYNYIVSGSIQSTGTCPNF